MRQSVSSDVIALYSTGPSTNLADAMQPFEMPRGKTQPIAIRELQLTQLTVGYREVAERRRRWRVGSTTVDSTARSLIVSVVLGPCARSYILDRYHQLCALAAEGVADVQVSVVEDHSLVGILFSLLPLFVVGYAIVDWVRGGNPLSVFQVIVMAQASLATLIDVVIFTWFSLRLNRMTMANMAEGH